jgi:hypothetical protein
LDRIVSDIRELSRNSLPVQSSYQKNAGKLFSSTKTDVSLHQRKQRQPVCHKKKDNINNKKYDYEEN